MSLVIGIIGEKGAGKEVVGNMIATCAFCRGISIKRHRFSDILNDTLRIWSITQDRSSLQKLARMMIAEFGDSALTKAMRAKIERVDSSIMLVDGVRWETDDLMIRSFPLHISLYVTASIDTRYARSKKRNDRIGEQEKTFDQFQLEECAQNEVYIPCIGSSADYLIVNEGTVEALREKVLSFFDRCITPKLKLQAENNFNKNNLTAL